MISKQVFKEFVDVLEEHNNGMTELQSMLKVYFDDNFLTHTSDSIINILGKLFFTEEQLKDLDNQCTIQTVIDLIYHFCYTCDFGLRSDKLKRLYVEDEGLETEEAFDAYTTDQLYDTINRYIHSPLKKTYLINC